MKKILVLLAFILSTLTVLGQVRISEQGKEFIKKEESCVLKAYWDTNGYSIGYGHHKGDVYKGMVITKQKAEEYFNKDIASAEKSVQKMIDELSYKYEFSQGFIDGFVSFVYNVGAGNARKSIFYNRLKNCRVKDGKMNKEDLEYAIAGIKLSIIRCAAHKKRRSGEYDLMRKLPDILPDIIQIEDRREA